jgi:hypothetical protein
MLIGLYSSLAGAGKSSVANHLIGKYGFTQLSFAEPLKDMVGVLLENFGYSPQLAHTTLHTRKQNTIPEIDHRITARHLLQTLGTEWGRQCVHPDVWVSCWQARYMRLISQGYDNIVVDDVRFLNEAGVIDCFSGELWKIDRHPSNCCLASQDHESEGNLDNVNDLPVAFAHTISNNETLGKLYANIDTLVTH